MSNKWRSLLVNDILSCPLTLRAPREISPRPFYHYCIVDSTIDLPYGRGQTLSKHAKGWYRCQYFRWRQNSTDLNFPHFFRLLSLKMFGSQQWTLFAVLPVEKDDQVRRLFVLILGLIFDTLLFTFFVRFWRHLKYWQRYHPLGAYRPRRARERASPKMLRKCLSPYGKSIVESTIVLPATSECNRAWQCKCLHIHSYSTQSRTEDAWCAVLIVAIFQAQIRISRFKAPDYTVKFEMKAKTCDIGNVIFHFHFWHSICFIFNVILSNF
jgi:hypothetical protein